MSTPATTTDPARTDWRTRQILGRPWQDVVFAAGEIVFLITLLPLFLSDAEVPAITGLGTGGMLLVFAAAHVSYGNWITVTLTTIAAAMWVLTGLGLTP